MRAWTGGDGVRWVGTGTGLRPFGGGDESSSTGMGGQAQRLNRADIKSVQNNKNTCGMSHERCVMSHSMQAPTGGSSGYVRYAATRVNMGLRAADGSLQSAGPEACV